MTGTVDNFRGNAVGNNWEAELKEAPLRNKNLSSTAVENFGLVKVSDAHDGVWHGRAYGGEANGKTPTKRPTGIAGAFRAFFPDGRAIGGFATRKED